MDETVLNDDLFIPQTSSPSIYLNSYFDGRHDMIMPDMMQLFGNDFFTDQVHEPKRKRVSRACEMCRKKKIKCDGRMPACSQCDNHNTKCIFTTPSEKKRSPYKGTNYVEDLEKRLCKLECLLSSSVTIRGENKDMILQKDSAGSKTLHDMAQTRAHESEKTSKEYIRLGSKKLPEQQPTFVSSHSTPQSLLVLPEPQNEDCERNHGDTKLESLSSSHEALSDVACSLITNKAGSSPRFSIYSPSGIEVLNEKNSSSSLQKLGSILKENKWNSWQPDAFSDLFQRRIFKKLPPKPECESLLQEFFKNINLRFPLFHQPTFMYLVHLQYSQAPYGGSGWWASLNVALALTHRLRAMNALFPKKENDDAWGYLKNSMAVFSELTLANNDLFSVQALLGLALFMSGTSNSYPSMVILAAAIRSSHAIGLHRRGLGLNLNHVESEQRKRVFWIGYILDISLSLKSGQPPAQDYDDINQDFPSDDPEDDVGNIIMPEGSSKMNFFRLLCIFATIQSKVYKQIYSINASKKSDDELIQAVENLNQMLEEWKNKIPINIRPGSEIKGFESPLKLSIVLLHLAYYNCLMITNRISFQYGYRNINFSNHIDDNSQNSNSKLVHRISSSVALCVVAARTSINLIIYLPQGNSPHTWFSLNLVVAAFMTLVKAILNDPQNSQARSDAELLRLVTKFLSILSFEDKDVVLSMILDICSELERIATATLEQAEIGLTKRKRENQEQLFNQLAHIFKNNYPLNPIFPSPLPFSYTGLS